MREGNRDTVTRSKVAAANVAFGKQEREGDPLQQLLLSKTGVAIVVVVVVSSSCNDGDFCRSVFVTVGRDAVLSGYVCSGSGRAYTCMRARVRAACYACVSVCVCVCVLSFFRSAHDRQMLYTARVAKAKRCRVVSTRVASLSLPTLCGCVCVYIHCVYVPNVLRPKYLAKCICSSSCLCNFSPGHAKCMRVCVCAIHTHAHLLWPRAWKRARLSSLSSRVPNMMKKKKQTLRQGKLQLPGLISLA